MKVKKNLFEFNIYINVVVIIKKIMNFNFAMLEIINTYIYYQYVERKF